MSGLACSDFLQARSDFSVGFEVDRGFGVADMAVQSDVMEAAGPYDRARALKRL